MTVWSPTRHGGHDGVDAVHPHRREDVTAADVLRAECEHGTVAHRVLVAVLTQELHRERWSR